MGADAVTTEGPCPDVTFVTNFLLHSSQYWTTSKTPALFGRLLSSLTELLRYYPNLLRPADIERLRTCFVLSSHWTEVDRKKVHDGVLFLREAARVLTKRSRVSDEDLIGMPPTPESTSTLSIEPRVGARRERSTESAWTQLAAFVNAVDQPIVWSPLPPKNRPTGRDLQALQRQLSNLDAKLRTGCALVRRARDR